MVILFEFPLLVNFPGRPAAAFFTRGPQGHIILRQGGGENQ